MKKISVLLVIFVTSIGVMFAANQPVSELVESYKKNGKSFTPISLFQENATLNKNAEIEAVTPNATILTIDAQKLQTALRANPSSMSLELPILGKKALIVDLVQVDIFAPGFSVKMSDNKNPKVDLGLHYRGIIQGQPNTLVAISLFEHEVMGFVADEKGNRVLGLLENNKNGEHILYYDNEMNVKSSKACEMPEDFTPMSDQDFDIMPKTAALNNCLGIYIEVDDDIYSSKGSNTTSFVTGLFNQSATIYANDDIDVALSDLFIWTSSSPYTSSSSSGMLGQFQSNRNSFNGDLGQLLSYGASGGIAAGFNGICASNLDNSQCFSSIQSSYNNVPTYSWSVMVFTHELGHLMGSRHTHACVWNGNNTAIDGCQTLEGSCSNPGYPSGGGTIMSYCHLQSVGINFNNGFGPQPAALIRSRIASGSCLGTCGGSGATCSDGIQNGDETGVDCGGSSCPACPTNCTENSLTLSITLDNYPGETSWTITSGGTTYASGGNYGSNPTGSTVSIPVCLADGCYDFNIFDTYGDGICCAYGNGSYALTGNGTTYASGGAFTTSETTNFCLNGGPAPSCDDGIQNGDETGVDCGGSCPACPTGGCTDIDINSYSILAYSTQDAGSSTQGAGFISIQNNAWKYITLNYNITANTVLNFEFGSTAEGEIHGIGFDSDNSISSNLTFKVHGTQTWGIADYDNYSNVGYWVSYSIPVGQFYTGATDRLFFIADHDASPSNGNSYFRNIQISEGGCLAALTNGEVKEPIEAALMTSLAPSTGIRLYPNPANETLNLQLGEIARSQLSVVDIYGRTVMMQTTEQTNLTLDISQLSSGMYFLQVESNGEKKVEKFVVER